jgi:hypothetical protein
MSRAKKPVGGRGTTRNPRTGEWHVKGVSAQDSSDAVNKGKANSAKKGLEGMSGDDNLRQNKKKFVSRMRVSAEGLKETGFTGFEAQAELLRDWSKKGFSERGRRKRRDHASRVLQENFPKATKNDAEAIVSKPAHNMEGGVQFDNLGRRFGYSGMRGDYEINDDLGGGLKKTQNELLNLVKNKMPSEESWDLGDGVRIKPTSDT